jgi:aryl-alcohol dehydrogenase-like predicted oxidoreductase
MHHQPRPDRPHRQRYGARTSGFSRLSLKTSKSEAEATRLIHEAVVLGINFIDTAVAYGTKAWWASRSRPSRTTRHW